MKSNKKSARFHVMNLPRFLRSEAETDSKATRPSGQFTPSELVGGFIVGPENRLVELAYGLAVRGVPIFDRAVGSEALEPIVDYNGEPSRADVELLLRAARDGVLDSFLENADSPAQTPLLLFDKDQFNAARNSSRAPTILGYRPLEEVAFLTPLVFYGPSGSGKSQIIQGICQERRNIDAKKTLYYLSATDFSRALADAIRREETGLFTQLLSQANVVAIEDADLLAEKVPVQQAMLTMLDDSIRSRKFVALSFSRNPSTIRGFIPELQARLSGGLLIPTRLPTEETRRVVVGLVADKLGLPLNSECRELCCSKLPASIGAICSALVQAAHDFTASRTPLDSTTLEEFLARRNPARRWTLERIIKTVAKYFSLSVVDIRGKKRSKSLALARRCVVFFARKLTSATFQEIGRQFSNRDHSTMIHAFHEIENELKTDEELKFHMREIARLLKAEELASL